MSTITLLQFVEALEAERDTVGLAKTSVTRLATRLKMDGYQGRISRSIHDRANSLLPPERRKPWARPSLSAGQSFAVLVIDGDALLGRITVRLAPVMRFSSELASEADYLRLVADSVKGALRIRHPSISFESFEMQVELLNHPFRGSFEVEDRSHGLAVAAALASFWLQEPPKWQAVASATVEGSHLGRVRDLNVKVEALRRDWGCTVDGIIVSAEGAPAGTIGAFSLVEGIEATTGIGLGQAMFPWRPLVPYEDTDEGRFYGRVREVARVRDAVAKGKITVLHGPSGVGKTSVLRAGVVPALRRAGWDVHVPTANGRVPRPGTFGQGSDRCCVVIDHGEALSSEDDLSQIEKLRRSGVALLIATRSLEKLQPDVDIGEAIPLKAMSDEQLVEVLEGPFAPYANTVFVEGAAKLIAVELSARKGGDGTALLGLLFMALWPKILCGDRISYEDAKAAFGNNLLSTQGEAVLRALRAHGVEPDSFLGLFVKCLPDRFRMRQQRSGEELAALLGASLPRTLFDALVSVRLFTEVDRDRFELTHDLVLERWDHLRELLDRSHDALELRDALEREAAQRSPSPWTGDNLKVAARAVEARDILVSERARRFLQDSLKREITFHRVVNQAHADSHDGPESSDLGAANGAARPGLVRGLGPVAWVDVGLAALIFGWYGERLLTSEYFSDPLTVLKLGMARGAALSLAAGAIAASAFILSIKVGFSGVGWHRILLRRLWPILVGPVVVGMFHAAGGLEFPEKSTFLLHQEQGSRVAWIIKDLVLVYPIALVVISTYWHIVRSHDIIGYLQSRGNHGAAHGVIEARWTRFGLSGYLVLVAAFTLVMGAMLAPDYHWYAQRPQKNWAMLVHIPLQCLLGLSTALFVLFIPHPQRKMGQ